MKQTAHSRFTADTALVDKFVPRFRLFIQCGMVLCLVASLLFASSSPAGAVAGYGDVAGDRYFTEPVQWSVDNDITGIDGACFDPDAPVSRGETAVWIWNMENQPSGFSHAFTDITDSSQEEAIAWMAETGITTGTSDTTFSPNDTLRRGQIAAFLHRLAGEPAPSNNHQFADVVAAWQQGPVSWMAETGITTGTSDTTFSPDNTLKRGELITFLYRYKGKPTVTVDPNSPTCQPTAATQFDRALEPLYTLGSSTSSKDLNGPVVFDVHYCGQPNDPSAYSIAELARQVASLQTHIDAFYRAESQHPLTGRSGTNIRFEVGQILEPSNGWALGTLRQWFVAQDSDNESYIPGYKDPCRQAVINEADNNPDSNYPRSIILANRPTGGTAGYAWTGGPAVAATYEQHGRDEREFLHTVAHEIGHVYGLKHPWQDLALDVFNNAADRHKYVTDEIEKARSLMSYQQFHGSTVKTDIRSTAHVTSRAYIACYQQNIKAWTDSCSDQILTPEDPAPPTLIPSDRSLRVIWEAPDDRGAEIVDYDLRYRPKDSKQPWLFVPVDNEQTATISGLVNGVEYEVRVQAENRVGPSGWSASAIEAPRGDRTEGPQSDPDPVVVLTVGGSAQGQTGADGVCTSVACRWLEVDVLNPEALGPGPYTLACAHNGVDAIGEERGVYDSATVSAWPATRSCLFGHPGSEVFVVVGAERRGTVWHGGHYSNVVVWPSPQDEDLSIQISWGSNASNRSFCPDDTKCLNLAYEYIGDWPSAPYQLECWHNGTRGWVGQWYGLPHRGCLYWGGTAQVVINGIRSNEITFPNEPTSKEVRISWGSDASNRSLCPDDTKCLNLAYEYIGDWPSAPYQLECWANGQRGWVGQWSGQPHTACLYWGGTAQVVINGIRSNEITFPNEPSPR